MSTPKCEHTLSYEKFYEWVTEYIIPNTEYEEFQTKTFRIFTEVHIITEVDNDWRTDSRQIFIFILSHTRYTFKYHELFFSTRCLELFKVK